MPIMSRSARDVAALVAATLRVDEPSGQLASAQAEVRRLEEVELPAAFTEDGVSEIGVPGCPRALKEVSVKGLLSVAGRRARGDAIPFYEAAKAWIIANGHKDSLRSVVRASM